MSRLTKRARNLASDRLNARERIYLGTHSYGRSPRRIELYHRQIASGTKNSRSRILSASSRIREKKNLFGKNSRKKEFYDYCVISLIKILSLSHLIHIHLS